MVQPRYETAPQVAERIGKGFMNAASSYSDVKGKQERESMISSELNSALEGVGEGMSDIQRAKLIAKQKTPEVRDELSKLLKNTNPSVRDKIAPEGLFANIVKRQLGGSPSPEALKRAEQIYASGSEYMQSGLGPVQSFNRAREDVDKQAEAQKKAKKELKAVKGKSFFGSNEKEDQHKINRLRKSKILSDDEIFGALTGLGYSPEDVESKFGIKMSDEMLDELSSQQEQEPEQPQMQGQQTSQAQQPQMQQAQGQPQRQRWDPKNPEHQQRALQILQEAKGDRQLANQALAQEFDRQ
jgi:hypothetical protein